MKKNEHIPPNFKTLKEMGEFWASHEFTEFQDEFIELEHPDIKIRDRSYLPVTLTEYEKLEKIASNKNITVDRLIQRWVQEKLVDY
jgi:hypothetical protein